MVPPTPCRGLVCKKYDLHVRHHEFSFYCDPNNIFRNYNWHDIATKHETFATFGLTTTQYSWPGSRSLSSSRKLLIWPPLWHTTRIHILNSSVASAWSTSRFVTKQLTIVVTMSKAQSVLILNTLMTNYQSKCNECQLQQSFCHETYQNFQLTFPNKRFRVHFHCRINKKLIGCPLNFKNSSWINGKKLRIKIMELSFILWPFFQSIPPTNSQNTSCSSHLNMTKWRWHPIAYNVQSPSNESTTAVAIRLIKNQQALHSQSCPTPSLAIQLTRVAQQLLLLTIHSSTLLSRNPFHRYGHTMTMSRSIIPFRILRSQHGRSHRSTLTVTDSSIICSTAAVQTAVSKCIPAVSRVLETGTTLLSAQHKVWQMGQKP